MTEGLSRVRRVAAGEVSKRNRSRLEPRSAARWFLVALLGAAAGFLLAEAGRSTPTAWAQSTQSAGGGGVFTVAGQITSNTYGIYLVDTGNGTICLYEYVPGERRLHFRAARTYRFDVQLDDHNTDPPPKEMRDLVEKHKRLSDTARP